MNERDSARVTVAWSEEDGLYVALADVREGFAAGHGPTMADALADLAMSLVVATEEGCRPGAELRARDEALREEARKQERAEVVAMLRDSAQVAASWGCEDRDRAFKDAARLVEQRTTKASP